MRKMFKLITLLLITLTLSVGASSKEFHFSTMKGPSSETGDCGGLSIWLTLKGNQFVEGSIAEFEGGCKVYKKEIININHNTKTGSISLYSPSDNGSTYIKFEGTYYYKNISLKGKYYYISPKNLLPVNSYSSDVELSRQN
jgi:hypothetical protein